MTSGTPPDPVDSGGAKKPLILVAVLALALFVGAIAYFYGDELISFAQALLSGPAPHAHGGHIRY